MPTYPTYKLGDVAEIILGQSPESKFYNTKGEGLPFFQGKTEFTDWFPIPNKWCTEPKKIAEPFDVLLSVRAPVGPTNIAKEKCCIGRGLAAIRYADCYKYVLYYLRSVSKYLESKATGTTFSSISGDTIKNLPIPLPPLPTQRAIVTRIETLFAELDKAAEHLRTAQQQIKIYRQAVLNQMLNNEDGKWKVVKLGEICSVLGDGLHGTPKFVENGDFYFINGNNLNGVIVIKQDTKTTNLEEFEKYKKNLNERTILISINGTLGNIAYYNGEPVVLGKSACYFNLLDGIEKDYVKYCLLSERFRSYAFKNATGSTIKNVPLKAMRMYSLPLPPLTDQHRIVQEIESRLSQAEASSACIENALQQAEALRQSILKKAFSGELV